MPNHCHNRVSFYSDDTTAILKLYNIFENGTNPKTEETVFGAFIPEPDWKTTPNEAGELPIQPDKDSMYPPKFPEGKTDDRWYSWRLANWGTKWDCYDLTIDEDELPNGFTAEFTTAWSPPEEVHSAISEQFDDLSVSWFYDEPGCEVAGYL